MRRLKISAIKLRWRGSRCWTITIAAKKSAGRTARIWLSARRPPAEAASATMSKAPLQSEEEVRNFDNFDSSSPFIVNPSSDAQPQSRGNFYAALAKIIPDMVAGEALTTDLPFSYEERRENNATWEYRR